MPLYIFHCIIIKTAKNLKLFIVHHILDLSLHIYIKYINNSKALRLVCQHKTQLNKIG